MHPILYTFHNVPWFGDVPIRSCGVMVMLGVVAGTWWLAGALRALGVQDKDAVGDLVTLAIITGFLGARWTYLAIHPEAWHGPLSLIALWEGGIVSYGGFFGGAIGSWWFARKRRIPVPRLGDAMMPALFLGQIFGRIGCFLVGDDYGRPTDLPWAVTFPNPKPPGSLIPDELAGVPLHPAQLYLSLMNLVIFLVLARVFWRRRYDGQVLWLTMVLYGIGRFLVEFTRGDDEARGFFGALSTAQWISIATVALGLLVRAKLPHTPVAPVRPAPSPAPAPRGAPHGRGAA